MAMAMMAMVMRMEMMTSHVILAMQKRRKVMTESQRNSGTFELKMRWSIRELSCCLLKIDQCKLFLGLGLVSLKMHYSEECLCLK